MPANMEGIREKIKTAILLDDFCIPNWQYRLVSQLMNSGFADIILIIKNNSAAYVQSEKKRSLAASMFNLIEKVDRLVFKTNKDYYIKKDLSETFKSIPRVDLNSGNDASYKDLNHKERIIADIRDLSPDIILNFGCRSNSDDLLHIPKYGVWAYSFDGCREIKLPDPGFWEVIRKVPVTGSKLIILNGDKDKSDVIFNSNESTCRYSININRDTVSWRSALYAPRIMKGIYDSGDDYLKMMRARFASIGDDGDRPIARPTFLDSFGCMLRYLEVVTQKVIKKLFFTDAFNWDLLIDISQGDELFSESYGSFRKLPSPRGVFWADPFVIAENGFYYIFVEEFVYSKDRAHISVLTVDKDCNLLKRDKIIEKPYHMSYPFVFKIGDTCYMIPETSKNKTIDLYKCTEFPDKWEFYRHIMDDISAVDTTLFRYNEKWWLFTAVDQTDNISGCSTELFLYYADDLFSGQWESHPLNPIVSDVRTARPAGKLFVRDSKICRPSQNCEGRYGIGFNINHITKLTESEYEEVLLSDIKPDWDKKLKGTHTLNFDKDFTVIDVYSFRKRRPF